MVRRKVAGEVPHGIRIHGADRERDGRLGVAPGAVAGDPAGGAGELAGCGFIEEGGENMCADGFVAATVFLEIEDETIGAADLGPVLVPFLGGGVVGEAVKGDVRDIAGVDAKVEELRG